MGKRFFAMIMRFSSSCKSKCTRRHALKMIESVTNHTKNSMGAQERCTSGHSRRVASGSVAFNFAWQPIGKVNIGCV